MKDYNPFGQATGAPSNISTTEPGEETVQGQFPQFGNTAQQNSQNTQASQNPQSGLGDLQAKIDAAKSNGWGSQVGAALEKYRKTIVLSSAIVLLVIRGLYIYRNNNGIPDLNLAAVSGSIDTTDLNFDNSAGGIEGSGSDLTIENLGIQLNEEGGVLIENELQETIIFAQLDESSLDGPVITKTATAGDGITHLARRALADYLQESGKSLSDEQKIYAEDYVQNRIGSEFLEVGQKLSFSKELLREAVESAESLENWQIENLKQYTENISLL